MATAAHSNPDVLIDIQHVTYTHWNKSEPTLHDISLQIRRGTLNILVGPSGSGKSTLCDLFNGVIPHLNGGEFKGDVFVDGQNTRDVKVKDLSQLVGRVFQDPEIMFATLSVEDEIAFGPENLRLDIPTIQSIVNRLLDQMDLTSRRHNLVWNLSCGQVQKLGLAFVLAMNPRMIVLDEPTSNLDPAATRDVHNLVLELRNNGITVLLVTRELDELLAEADQLLVMDNGRLLAAGPPRRMLREYGQMMIESLGVWLPETSEIGIRLLEAGILPGGEIPITVPETITALERAHLLVPVRPKHPTPDIELKSSAPPRGEVLISARNLRYVYPGGVEALKGIDLDIHAGEWLMILGRNGAGKSTLARMLVGLLTPQSDALTLFGRDARSWKVDELANHIALVFQNPEHQFLTDKVADEIGYSLLAQGITDDATIKARTDEMLEMLGLQDVADTHPFALSAGLKRRLGVATMLVGNPQVLVVDEPTYGQDQMMTHTLMARMQEIRERGVSVVMITHDMRLVEEYAERVVVMSEGEILYDGPSSGLFTRDEVLERANLRRTILHDLLGEMARRGMYLPADVRHTQDLLALLNVTQALE